MTEGSKTKLIGDAGEYLVAHQLCARGIAAALANKNCHDVDVFATLNGTKTAAIQVKTTRGKDSDRQWSFGRSFEGLPKSEAMFYVFVKLGADAEEPTDCFVVPSMLIEERHVINPKWWQFKFASATERDGYKDRWDLIAEPVNDFETPFFGI